VTGSGIATVAEKSTVIEAMSSRFKLLREETVNKALEPETTRSATGETTADRAEKPTRGQYPDSS
jgi:hypothetical protein